MNRFDRRLKSSGSPRPGTASCKIKKKNVKLVSNNVVVDEINNQKNLTNNIIIDDVQKKNEKIAERLKVCSNQSERILLNHEMRINNVELNVDCLNNLEENQINNENLEILKNNFDYLLNENTNLKEEVHNLTKKLNLFIQMNSSQTDNNKEKVVLDVKEVIDKEKDKTMKKTADKPVEKSEEKPTFA